MVVGNPKEFVRVEGRQLATDAETGEFSDLTVTGATDSLNGTFPGWGSGNSVSVGDGGGRFVVCTFTISSDSDSLARIQGQVEDNGGTMQTVAELEIPAGVLTSNQDRPMAFFVPANRSYQFIRSGNTGVTETNANYSAIDFGV